MVTLAEYKDLVVDEADGKARYNLVDRNGNIVASGVMLELASGVVQAGSDWGALEANLLLTKDANGVPSCRTDNPHNVTAEQTGAYSKEQTDAALGKKADTATVNAALDQKSDNGHNHDGRYYTEIEIDTKLDGKAGTYGIYPNLTAGYATSAGTAQALEGILPPIKGGTGQALHSFGCTSWVGQTDSNGRFKLSGLSDGLLVAVGSIGGTNIGDSKHCVSFASPEEAGPGCIIGNVFEAYDGRPVTGQTVRVNLIYFY